MPARHLAILAAAAVLAGCAMPTAPDTAKPGAPVFSIATPFDAAQARRLVAPGPNTVTGQAFIRQRGGAPVTCAGQPVYLVPATEYARIRVKALYGSADRGALLDSRSYRFEPDPPEYSRLVRQAQCDAEGAFRFDRVASGEFFITAIVRWQEGEARKGGSLMQRTWVRGGGVTNVVLSR